MLDAFIEFILGLLADAAGSVAFMIVGATVLGLTLWFVTKNPTRSNFWVVKFGWGTSVVLLLVGFVVTFALLILGAWEQYQDTLLSAWGFVLYICSIIFKLQNVVIVGIITVFLLFLIKLRAWKVVDGYNLTAIGVSHTKNEGLYIQVENVGSGNFQCAARLVSIARRDVKKGRGMGTWKPIGVSDIYPNSPFLVWPNNLGHQMVTMGIPLTIKFVTGSKHSQPSGMYGDRTSITIHSKFLFAGFGESKRLENGQYEIQVDFLRWNGSRYVPFIEYTDTFFVTYDGAEWKK